MLGQNPGLLAPNQALKSPQLKCKLGRRLPRPASLPRLSGEAPPLRRSSGASGLSPLAPPLLALTLKHPPPLFWRQVDSPTAPLSSTTARGEGGGEGEGKAPLRGGRGGRGERERVSQRVRACRLKVTDVVRCWRRPFWNRTVSGTNQWNWTPYVIPGSLSLLPPLSFTHARTPQGFLFCKKNKK